jgi:hypothetical protein
VENTNRLKLQQALEALEESTRTLEIAEQLLIVGNVEEAERLREEARQKREASVLLMAQAGDNPAQIV